MIQILILFGLLVISTTAFGEEAVLTIVVKQRTSVKQSAAPFQDVGLFEIHWGDTKFEDASCRNNSNKDGRLACTITCSTKDRTPKYLKVFPPAHSHTLKRFTAPPEDDVDLTGCMVSPTTMDFVYTHWPMTLYELFQGDPGLSHLASVDASGTDFTFMEETLVLGSYARIGTTSDGVRKLARLQRIATVAAEAALDEGDSANASKFGAYAIGVANYFLKEIYAKNIGVDQTRIQFTGARDDYDRNLALLEETLKAQIVSSPQQTLLLTEVQELRTSAFPPSMPSVQRRLTNHVLSAMSTPPMR